MKTGRLLVLAAVVVALAAYILLFERHQPTTAQAQKQAEKVLGSLKRSQITGLDIKNSHGTFVLVKSGDTWKLTKPIAYPADGTAISSAITGLVDLTIKRTLPPGEVTPKAYSLDKPRITVTIHTKDGTVHTVKVGAKAALGADRAVSVGDGRILMCSGFFVDDLDKDLDAWRSHRVATVFPDQVASLELTEGRDHVHAVRDGKLWKLLEPLEDLAGAEHIRNLISDINALRVVAFIDAPHPDLHALGLDKPRYKLVLVRTKGAKPIELDFGIKEKKNGTTRVACRRNGTDLFWVNDVAELPLGLAPVLWRSRKVYPFESWNVDALTLSSGGTSVALKRVSGMWKLAGGAPANGSEVLSRLGKLSELEAVSFDLVAKGPKQMGRAVIELAPGVGAAGKKPAKPRKITFTFFAPLRPGGRALVKVSARKTVMSVEVKRVDLRRSRQAQGHADARSEEEGDTTRREMTRAHTWLSRGGFGRPVAVQ
ncbi:MAG: DUF4340 domain-containing protein [Acidobacteria bacterium]|nr:DUF4340 domain-containing protein [Acidobacteriota bacterium]